MKADFIMSKYQVYHHQYMHFHTINYVVRLARAKTILQASRKHWPLRGERYDICAIRHYRHVNICGDCKRAVLFFYHRRCARLIMTPPWLWHAHTCQRINKVLMACNALFRMRLLPTISHLEKMTTGIDGQKCRAYLWASSTILHGHSNAHYISHLEGSTANRKQPCFISGDAFHFLYLLAGYAAHFYHAKAVSIYGRSEASI